MHVKDLFKLALKLIAIFYAFSAILLLIDNASYFIYTNNMLSFISLSMAIRVLAPVLVYYLVFKKSDWLVSVLNLDKGFENQQINFGSLSAKELIKITVLFLSLYMLFTGIPDFLSHCFYAFKYSIEPNLYIDNSYQRQDYFNWTVSGIYMLLGFLATQNYKRIANWIDK
ncbi:MAG: hypothetical protein JXR05_06915 [Flavobacteriaceae bacterium]